MKDFSVYKQSPFEDKFRYGYFSLKNASTI